MYFAQSPVPIFRQTWIDFPFRAVVVVRRKVTVFPFAIFAGFEVMSVVPR